MIFSPGDPNGKGVHGHIKTDVDAHFCSGCAVIGLHL